MAGLCIATVLLASCAAAAAPTTWQLALAPHSPLPGLAKANAIVIAELNSDGRPDLALINGNPGEMLVLFQHADGRFEATSTSRSAIGATASGIVASDVNRDGKSDLVLCFHDRDDVTVLLGKGNGEFESASRQTLMKRTRGNPHVHTLAVKDINGDRHHDIVVTQADDNLIAWALGDGTGAFRPSERTLSAGEHPYTITVADFNGDGRPDVAAPNAVSNDLTVGLNDGAGGFVAATGSRVALPPRTLALAAGDLNGDGHVDLVSSSDEDQDELSLLLGNGQGGFTQAPDSFTAPARCYGHVMTDVNADGKADLIAPCIDRSSVLVWLADDPATLRFQRVEFETPGTDSQVLAVGDINGDGILDIVTAGWARPTIAVLLGSRQSHR